MWRMGSCGLILVMLCASARGQMGYANIFSYAEGLHKAPGIWGTSGYSAAVSKAKTSAAGVFAERLYGTELTTIELAVRARVKAQVFQFNLSRSGTSFLSFNRAALSTGLKIGDALGLGLVMGFQFSMATGYPSAIYPFVGLGLGLQLSEKCRWMVQADDLNAFIMNDVGMRYRVRTGLAIQLSPISMLALESIAVEGEVPSFLASIHYNITDDVFTRIGFATGSSVFNLAVGLNRKSLQLGFYSGWQISLGLSAGISISCSFKTDKP